VGQNHKESRDFAPKHWPNAPRCPLLKKDIPAGAELSLSAKQIDCIPPEIENRIPDFYMNGNKAWLVGARSLAG
jgi:hypothetical protein